MTLLKRGLGTGLAAVATAALLLSSTMQAQVVFTREKTFTAATPTVVESVTFGPLTASARLGAGSIGLFLSEVDYGYGSVSLNSLLHESSQLSLIMSGLADGRYSVKLEFSNASVPITVTVDQSSCTVPQGSPKSCEFPFAVSGGNKVWFLRMPLWGGAGLIPKVNLGAITVNRFSSR